MRKKAETENKKKMSLRARSQYRRRHETWEMLERRVYVRRTVVKHILTIAALAAAALLVLDLWVFRGTRHEPRTWERETTQVAVTFKNETSFRQELAVAYPRIGKMLKTTYVIPGLKATRTLQGTFRAYSMCTVMTPQGMCVTEDYIMVSAYCHTHRHNSVIYLMRRSDGALLKTIPLGGKAHVGGMAYDPVHQNVWVSGGVTGSAKAVGYSLESLVNYDETSAQPARAKYNYTLATITRNSYMTYIRDALLVGFFSRSGRSDLERFNITADGGLKARMVTTYDALYKSVSADFMAFTPGEVQSVAEYDPFILLGRSYGMTFSSLQIYRNTDVSDVFTTSDARKIISFPQKMEQVYPYDGQLYCLFEAGAYAYRLQPRFNSDRIMVFDMDDLLPGYNEKDSSLQNAVSQLVAWPYETVTDRNMTDSEEAAESAEEAKNAAETAEISVSENAEPAESTAASRALTAIP